MLLRRLVIGNFTGWWIWFDSWYLYRATFESCSLEIGHGLMVTGELRVGVGWGEQLIVRSSLPWNWQSQEKVQNLIEAAPFISISRLSKVFSRGISIVSNENHQEAWEFFGTRNVKTSWTWEYFFSTYVSTMSPIWLFLTCFLLVLWSLEPLSSSSGIRGPLVSFSALPDLWGPMSSCPLII